MKRTVIKNWMYRWTEPSAAPLSATVLLVLATSRMAYALMCVFTLLWTFIASSLVRFVLRKFMPHFGRNCITVFLSALVTSLFYLFLHALCPALALECSLFISFTPVVYCLTSMENVHDETTLKPALLPPVQTALSISTLVFALALIREPLGYATLTAPGGSSGVIELLSASAAAPYAIQLIASPAGALILLGFTLGLFRSINRERDTGIHPEQKNEETP